MAKNVILTAMILLLPSSHCKLRKHSIEKRFIYPIGSVMQFAMGLALPATVTGRNIATNSGILINYALPTNITDLKLPDIESTRFGQNQILDGLMRILNNYDFDEECLNKSLCLLEKNKRHENTLLYQIVQIILKKILHYDGFLSRDNHSRRFEPNTNCNELSNGCKLLQLLF